MKNIHLITIDKPSRLCINGKNGQPIYITSDKEIKEGDWVYCLTENRVLISNVSYSKLDDRFKIILTTDQDLIKDGVQTIDDEFLEWFVNNPSCEEVEVQERQQFEPDKTKRENPLNGIYYSYKIIIPKEEQKQHLIDMMRYDEELGLYEEPKQDWYCPKCDSYVSSESVTFEETHQTCNTGVVIKEPKKETLEEAAEKQCEIEGWGLYEGLSEQYAIKNAFIEGAKLQSQRMYSEEEVFNLCRAFATFVAHKDPSYKKQQEWFEQFKKK